MFEPTKILDQIIADLPNITVANGYYHNVKPSQVFKKIVSLTAFPCIMVVLSTDTASTVYQDDKAIDRTIDFHILVNFKVDNDAKNEGLLTDEQLKWRSDIGAWVAGQFGKDKSFDVGAVPSIQHRWVETQDPFLDHKELTGLELNILRITYTQDYH